MATVRTGSTLVAAGSTLAELQREVDLLRAKLAARSTMSLKVSEKGGVSLYGVRRFPVTFYASEWPRILSMAGAINTFMTEHRAELSAKPE